MKKIILLCTVLTCILTLHAQEKLKKQYAKRPALGVHFTLTDFTTAQNIKNSSLNSVIVNKAWQKARIMSPGLAVTYMKGFSNHIDIQGRLVGSFLDLPMQNRTSNFGRDNFFLEMDASANLKMLSDKYWVSPFVNVGIGAANYKGVYWSAFAPVGLGLQLNFWDEAFLIVNSQYRLPITSSNNHHFMHSIGVAGNIGKPRLPEFKTVEAPVLPKDTDNDGIFDKDDACPTTAGVAKYKGCPVPDTDGDGINDDNDKCPTVKGTAKYNGCPVPDSDNDGINDEDDKCVNQAGVARYNGCPVPDTDGDGINDEEDKCKDVPGVASNQGCPEIKDEVVKKIEFAAKNIFFETGKATLKPASNKNLNEVVKILQDNPDLQLDVEGHTDNSGVAEKNQTLSENRANAVKAYLVSKGIDESRLTSAGFGQDQPIADNKAAAGKAKNRRVELKLRSY